MRTPSRSPTSRSTSPGRSERSTTLGVRSSLVAELTRVTRPGGTILVVDQLAPVDPLSALELNRFEIARATRRRRASSRTATCGRSST